MAKSVHSIQAVSVESIIAVTIDFITAYITSDSSINDTANIFWAEDKSGYDEIQYLTPYVLGALNIGGGWGEKESFTIRQKEFISASSIRAAGSTFGNSNVTYIIDGKYESITGIFGVDDITKSSGLWGNIEIVGDGNVLYSSPHLTRGDHPINVEVPLTGVQTLKISIQGSADREFFDIKLNK